MKNQNIIIAGIVAVVVVFALCVCGGVLLGSAPNGACVDDSISRNIDCD